MRDQNQESECEQDQGLVCFQSQVSECKQNQGSVCNQSMLQVFPESHMSSQGTQVHVFLEYNVTVNGIRHLILSPTHYTAKWHWSPFPDREHQLPGD